MEQKKSLIDVLKNHCEGSDDLLFHYTSLNAACSILSSKRLRLSNLTNMNDPLEFCGPNIFSFNGLEIDDMKKAVIELSKSLKEREKKVRLLCFCRDFFTEGEWDNKNSQSFSSNLFFKGWARTRMWAQYADNHRGVCLVFNKTEVSKKFKELQNNHTKILEPQKISYTNDFSKLEDLMTRELDVKNSCENFLHFYLDDERLNCLFIKCEDFKDENEYRFVLINNTLSSSAEECSFDFGTSLKAIILGGRFNPILKFSLPSNIEQFKITWNCGIPDLISF